MSGIPLTSEAHERVVALTRAGVPAREIAAILSVSERTIARVRVRCGIAKPPPVPFTEDEMRRAAQLLDDGASLNETARTIGRSLTAMCRHFPGRGWTPRQTYELVATMQRFRGVL